MKLSIVIVNYNVRDLLLNAIESLKVAMKGIDGEIMVVDNNSSDGAVEALAREYPDVVTFAMDRNLGFGGANNIGIERARGEYILLINPDTIVQEETLRQMIQFMEQHPDAGMAGCRILNPDGSLEPASKRGFPSPWSSFCRVFGLSRLFPKSRLFGGYNLTHLDPDKTATVDALSGCFMFCRAEVLHTLKGFDTDFFMYGEDLDLCYRAREEGWKIYYHPATSIMHLKGESTRRSSLDALAMFYEAMEIFARKHFRSNAPLLRLIRMGIRFRRFLARINERFPYLGFLPVDVAAVVLGFALGSWIKFDFFFDYPDYAMPMVAIMPPVAMTVTIAMAGGYSSSGDRIPWSALLGYLVGFFVLSTLPYFFKDYAFSRGVVLVTTAIATLLGVSARFGWILYSRTFGKRAVRRVAFLSQGEVSPARRKSVRWMFFGRPVALIGTVTPKFSQLSDIQNGALGSVENIAKIVREYRITDIVAIDPQLRYGEVIRAMGLTASQQVRFHVLRSGAETAETVGGEQPLQAGHDAAGSGLGKRLRDRLGALLFLLSAPVVYLVSRHGWRRIRELVDVLLGRRPLVGAGSEDRLHSPMFSIVELFPEESLGRDELRAIERYYAQNQSLLLDCEIIISLLRLRNLPKRPVVERIADGSRF